MSTATENLRSLLLDSARRLFTDGFDEEVQEAVERGEWPSRLWQAIEDNGLPLALVPEERGGVGLSVADAAGIIRLAGAYALPLPLAETMIAQWLAAAAERPPFEGPAAVAPSQPGGHAELCRRGGELVLEGAIGTVPWGREGSTLALVASAEHMASGVALVSLNPAETPGVPVTTAIGEPTTAWTFSASKVNADAVVALPHVISGDTVLRAGALFRVALIAGALERVLDLTIEHAREREQFGRPIARFQAVQQEIAQLAGFSAAAGAALEAAVAAVGEDLADPEGAESAGSGGAELAVAAAKARASAVVAPACAIAHQIHAAIGFTREHALHRFTRRLWTWRDQFGSEATWWQRVGQAVRTAGGDGLWSLISGT